MNVFAEDEVFALPRGIEGRIEGRSRFRMKTFDVMMMMILGLDRVDHHSPLDLGSGEDDGSANQTKRATDKKELDENEMLH